MSGNRFTNSYKHSVTGQKLSPYLHMTRHLLQCCNRANYKYVITLADRVLMMSHELVRFRPLIPVGSRYKSYRGYMGSLEELLL